MKLVFLFVVVTCLALANKSEQYETGAAKFGCQPAPCTRRCWMGGRGFGKCIDDVCVCDNPPPLKRAESSEDLMEGQTEQQMAGCVLPVCHWECAKLKAKRGLCIKDQCYCSST